MHVVITLLGEFTVAIDGTSVPATAWSRRHAASLVKLLSLAEGRSLHREQVLDALWPSATPEAALPRLHKAAHYARRALDGPVVLEQDWVRLLPEATVSVDALEFRSRADQALAEGSRELAEQALASYAGRLLPEDLYEDWSTEWRDALAALHRDLLRLTGRWADLVAEDPTDETAHLALAREHARRGDLRSARRQLERLEHALRRELGIVPGPEVRALQVELANDNRPGGATVAARPGTPPDRQGVRLVGRRAAGDAVRSALDRAEAGRGGTLLISGPAGIGKSAVLDLAIASARQRGWRVARGAASAVEVAWPYAPVLEAFGDLARRHPALLDGLDDAYREQLERALSGEQRPWTGESTHQRLFVAAAELVRLAAADHGLLLVVDDLHEADDASARLLHYLARCASTERVLVALAMRPAAELSDVEESLVARGIGRVLPLTPLDDNASRRLVALAAPDLDEATVTEICRVAGGVPFRLLEAARAARGGASGHVAVSALPRPALEVLRVTALLGSTFTTDELLLTAAVEEDAAYDALEAGLATSVVEPAETGYRFRHALVRDALLDTFTPAERARAGREVATRMAEGGAPATRVAHLYLASGHPAQAIPFVQSAVETAGALGAYRDGLALIDAVVDHASGSQRPHLLARRGDLLLALADPAAISAYRSALAGTTGTEHRLVRARLARAATFEGDFDTAATALVGMELEGDAADGPLLLARGNLAYFQGDHEGARAAADAARATLRPEDSWQAADLVALQGLLAHQRGEWFERYLLELRRTQDDPHVATAIFDAHLCVAEYLLYGPIPYAEVIDTAEQLRRRAMRDGALRGAAFATALIGEAALLRGDLARAEEELAEAVDLHHDLDARAGEAHSLQRLAEVRLYQGDRSGARELLRRSLRLAHWSVMAPHLLQRTYGTLVIAAEGPLEAAAVVDEAEAAMGEDDQCTFCDVMFAVPAAVACADAGRLEDARRQLARAEKSAGEWTWNAWAAAVLEARAHLALAEGDPEAAAACAEEAAAMFDRAEQPLDADRCRSFVVMGAATG